MADGLPTPEYEKPLPLPGALLAAVLRAEDHHVRRVVEWLSVFDPRGTLLATRKGDAHGVSIAGLEWLLRDATMTHNHPLGTTFTVADVGAAMRHNLMELRVVAEVDGVRTLYRLQRPAAGWPALGTGALEDAFAEALPAGLERAMTLRDAGRWAADVLHFGMEHLAERFGLRYSREQEPPCSA
jgi:hypothetical protein